MKRSKNLMCGVAALPLAALGVTLVAGQRPQALAQPDLKRQGAGENPGFADARPDAGRNPKLPGERKPGEARPDAVQYRKAMEERGQQMRENFVRQALMRQGVNDEKTQNAILECARAQETAKQAVQEKAGKLRPALVNADAIADAQFNALLNEYQVAIEDYRDGREKAAKELDAKIGYSKKPRLQAALLMMNIVGDAPQDGLSMNLPGMSFAMATAQNFKGEFAGGFQAGAVGKDGQNFKGQNQDIPGGARIFEGKGAPPNGEAGRNDPQMNEQLGQMRREFGEQIKLLREEINRIKAAQGNR